MDAPPEGPSRRWLAAAFALFAAFLALHLPVTDGFDWFAWRFGFETYNAATREAFAAIGLLVAAAAWVAPPRPRRLLVGGSTTALLVLALAARRLLIVVSIEAIHYPQYALMAAVLVRAGLTLEQGFAGATALGAIDELYQFLALPRGRPTYFDWNDVVLNAIGAAFGSVAMLAWARRRTGARGTRPAAAAAAATVTACTGGLLLFPRGEAYFATTPGGQQFLKLAGSEAIAVAALLWFAIAWMDERCRDARAIERSG